MTIIPNWLRQRAYLSPDKLAIVAGSERWTFHELDMQADQAARRLITLGTQADSRVALLMRNGRPDQTVTSPKEPWAQGGETPTEPPTQEMRPPVYRH